MGQCLSFCAMDSGLFDDEGSLPYHTKSRTVNNVTRERGVFKIDAYVEPAVKGEAKPEGFGRLG